MELPSIPSLALAQRHVGCKCKYHVLDVSPRIISSQFLYLQEEWGFVGGIARCGAYCSAWGCGANRTNHYTQGECAPPLLAAKL
jgi:hypothetical protein